MKYRKKFRKFTLKELRELPAVISAFRLSKALNISYRTMYTWIRHDGLPVHRQDETHMSIFQHELEAWMDLKGRIAK